MTLRARQTRVEDFAVQNNTLVRDVANRVEDRIGIEIGDSKQAEFFPQAKIMRWDNETNFSIRRDNGARSFVERDGKIVAESRDENVVIYELEPDEQNEDGGLEIEIELPRRPRSNVFEFTLQTKGLNFYYQPELTEKEKAEGASQPDNVIGSYAVYHATKRNNRIGGKHYKTGKAFHIYRPKAIDANGAEVWCELNIDEEASVLTVTVPQDWLNRASYPVRVDPTFGYTSVGGSEQGAGVADTLYFYSISTLVEDNAEIESISLHNGTFNTGSPRSVKPMILDQNYKIVHGSIADVQLPQVGSRQWNTSPIPAGLVINSGQWALGWIGTGGGSTFFSWDSGGGNLKRSGFSTNDFDNPQDPINIATARANSIFSVYATYEVAASDDPPSVTTNATDQITDTTARFNGNVTDDGGATITERGFVYSTSPNPTVADTKKIVSGTTGAYNVTETGLTPETTYYVRAYAINSEGTSYGDDDEFTTDVPGLGKVSVQHEETQLTGTTTDITIDPVVLENSWVRLTTRIGAIANAHDVTGELIDSTTLRLTRENSTGTNEVSWFVVEDSNASVQRGVFTMESSEDDETLAIDSVDLSKSFIAITVRSEGGTMNIGYVTATFENSTTVRLRRQQTGDRIHVSWEVVEIADATVQSGYTHLTGTIATESITAVDQDHAFILSHRSAGAQNLDRSHARSSFNSNTEIEFWRTNSDSDMYIGWFVVECPRYTVQVADSGFIATQVINTAIDPVNLSRTWLTTTTRNNGGGTSNANARFNVYFDGNDTVVRHKASTSQQTHAHTYVIEMEPVELGPQILITKVKVAGTFVPIAPKVKIGGTFVEKTSKVKVGGTFV